VISGAVFLIITFIFIPLRFYDTLAFNKELSNQQVNIENFKITISILKINLVKELLRIKMKCNLN
jgi:hypothetical protein